MTGLIFIFLLLKKIAKELIEIFGMAVENTVSGHLNLGNRPIETVWNSFEPMLMPLYGEEPNSKVLVSARSSIKELQMNFQASLKNSKEGKVSVCYHQSFTIVRVLCRVKGIKLNNNIQQRNLTSFITIFLYVTNVHWYFAVKYITCFLRWRCYF